MNQPLASPSLWTSTPESKSGQNTRPGAFELKFPISQAVGSDLLEWVSKHMSIDPHSDPLTGGYLVEGIYLDTPELDVYKRSPRYARSKMRIRRYSGSNVQFLEQKSKRRGLVSKLRIPYDRESFEIAYQEKRREVDRKVNNEGGPEGDRQDDVVSPESPPVQRFVRRIVKRRLYPTVLIRYQRTAFMQMDANGPIRLTIDRGIECGSVDGWAYPDQTEFRSVGLDGCVLELKYRDTLPNRFRELIEKFQLVPKSFSKYRSSIETMGLHQGSE